MRADLDSARAQPEPTLLNNVPSIIEALAEVLERGHATSKTHALFMGHANTRLDWTDYSSEELIREYGILRKVIFSVLEEQAPLTATERDLILDFIEEGIQIGNARYSEAQLFHERLELQYLKLVEHLVAASAGGAGTSGGLEGFLDVILRDLDAEAAAFFLYGEDTLELKLAATAGRSKELAALYHGALALSQVSAPGERGEAVRLVDVTHLEPTTRQSLNELGVHWLVWIELLSHGRLPGALCLGFREKRAIEPIELQLLEVLGDRLALLLASIRLQEESKLSLERARRKSNMLETERNHMDEERRRRDELIASISHDLKNPLHTARLGAELIRRGGGAPEATQKLAEQILTSISRSDRMIHDMLDCQRVRAGKRLPLETVEFRMNDLVEEVVAEMRRKHGDRFVVEAEPNVQGYWSWDGMQRVLENLLTNAIKYSDPLSPITIRVKVGEGGRMCLSVHNQGPRLSREDQARIFLPFERAKSAELGGKRGWGIGLTLVRGIIDGHGGDVSVESTERGTTFTVSNPMDSRPYQQDDRASGAAS